MRAPGCLLVLILPLASCLPPEASTPPVRSSAEAAAKAVPPLDHAPLLRAKQAADLAPDEPVLGIEIAGDARAYPLRSLDRHAVANDTVGRVPVAVAWCRPCGSAVAYRRDTPRGTLTLAASRRFQEGDPLLRDRPTGTLWRGLTGTAVEGPLAGAGVELQALPVVLTTWGSWLRLHPETRVLAPGTGGLGEEPPPVSRRGAGPPGTAAIYGLVVDGTAKAYSVDRLAAEGVVNDELAGRAVVLVSEPGADGGHRTVRAYERRDLAFARNERPFLGAIFLVDQRGRPWRLGEEALTRPDGESLPRLPGRLSHRSGWVSAYPQSLRYE